MIPTYDAPREADGQPPRTVLEQHLVVVQLDSADGFVRLPLRAVRSDVDPCVEMGPLSLSADDARLLAQSLLILADLAEPRSTNRKDAR